MSKTKLLAGVLLILMLLAGQVGVVAAAPLAQDATIQGTVTNIEMQTDAEGVTTVLVTLLLVDQTTQTVRISLVYAIELGLIDPTTQEPVPLDDLTEDVTINPNEVISDEEPTEPDVHPISALLAAFFGEDSTVVDSYHQDGFGFGVIVQALWMSQNLNGDTSVADLILEAKRSGDYSAFTLPDGSIPKNWGQFKKEVLKKKNNLGIVVSGQADPLGEEQTQEGNGNDHNKDKNKNKDKGKGRKDR